MRFVLILLALCSLAAAQEPMTVSVRIESYAEFSSPPRIISNRAYYAKGSKIAEGDMGFVVIKGDVDAVIVDAVRAKLVGDEIVTESADVTQVGRKQFAITGTGKYSVQVTGFIATKDAQGETFLSAQKLKAFPITLGEIPPPKPEPKPDPKPEPDTVVAPDGFDNLGQRIAQWSAGLPKRNEVGAIYAKYANKLAKQPSFQILEAFTGAQTDRVALLGADAPKYADIVAKINADIVARGPMGKGVVIDYFRAMARGFGAKVE